MCESHTSPQEPRLYALPYDSGVVTRHRAPKRSRGQQERASAGNSDFAARAPALAQRGAQDGLGGVGCRARGDRVDVSEVEVTEVDAVEGDPRVVARGL